MEIFRAERRKYNPTLTREEPHTIGTGKGHKLTFALTAIMGDLQEAHRKEGQETIEKKYGIIYADPPWKYAQKRLSGAAEHHYPTMSIEELCALPVADLAAEDSALFLWATFPQLHEALRLIKAWGFTYKTAAFVWLKLNKKSYTWFYGLGFWTRGNAEICLLATRGHPKRKSAGIHQFIISPIEQHSKKPDITRDKIVALMGDIPRIELFARQETAGWDTWGNETKNSIEL